MNAFELAVIALTSALVYVYVGYPVFIWIVGTIWKSQIRKAEWYPSVSIVIAAHNEESAIRGTIINKLELDYPKERMQIIVVSDASTDGTDEIVKEFANCNVCLTRQEPRQGKTAALNRSLSMATGEIVVFSDANSIYDKNALKQLVYNFADPSVGYVTGRMEYVASPHSHVGGGTSSYMKYENKLRELETLAGSVVGVDGGIDAVRRGLYAPMDPSLLPDLVLPLSIVEKGYRVVYEPDAVLQEEALRGASDEYRMRVRVALRAFHALWHKRALLNPFRHGLYSVQLFSHKLLRYLSGFLMIAVFICSIVARETWTLVFSGIQTLAYLSALIGFWQNQTKRVSRGFRYPFYFCLINFASAAALVKFLSGQKMVIWTPRQG